MHLNFEFKAKTNHLTEQENKFLTLHPKFIGEDHQIDTYFNCNNGRLKLREGNIENALIQYNRADTATAKQSDVTLYQTKDTSTLKALLTQSNGIKVIVDKTRKIYFIDNVKFHFDVVKNLGTFIEVEAIDADETIGIEKLQQQCNYYKAFFNIEQNDFIHCSYSDLLLNS